MCNTGNKALCGKPLTIPCKNKSIVTLPQQGNAKKHQKVLIVVIILVIVFVLASILALLFIQKSQRKRPQSKSILGLQLNSQKSPSVKESQSIDLTGEFTKGDSGELNFVNEDKKGFFDLQDLLRASAEVLGSGSFGSTYKAIVLNGPIVVVKRFKHMNNFAKQEFFEHMQKLGSLTHPNLLPLVAFYYRKDEKFLVYDFGENGSLASHLHGMVYYILRKK